MILTDAGPLVASLDRLDNHYRACAAVVAALPRGPFLTTWPCFTESMHLLHVRGGYRYQAALWAMYSAGRVVLHDSTPDEAVRMASLMEQYQDTPMDLADASLVAAAESRSERRLFTLDRHFWIYRLSDGSALEPVPGR
ncbi:MAG TPA: hypothetical protein VFQ45_05675 [Longimicrobium sp.]|nr:hypothetical protein [Longimicrobium sp.]